MNMMNQTKENCMNIMQLGYRIKELLTSVYNNPVISYFIIDNFSNNLNDLLKTKMFYYNDCQGSIEFTSKCKFGEDTMIKIQNCLIKFLREITYNNSTREVLCIANSEKYNELLRFIKTASDEDIRQINTYIFAILFMGQLPPENYNLYRINLY